MFFIIGCTLTFFCTEKTCAQPSFETPDSLIHLFYKVLSGPAGERNWELYKSLYHEKAIMGSIGPDAQGHQKYKSFTPAEYIERNGAFFRRRDFYIEEIHHSTGQFGDIMHIFSTYQYRLEGGTQGQQKGRGINCIQLIRDADRWWIISIQWTNERPDLPIPQHFGG
jgi:hypothetical protein